MEFLTFKTFISGKVLIFIYYLGAVGLPFAVFNLTKWLINRYDLFDSIYKFTKLNSLDKLSKKQRVYFVVICFIIFLFMELIWRVMIEFLLAYIQIRDILVVG